MNDANSNHPTNGASASPYSVHNNFRETVNSGPTPARNGVSEALLEQQHDDEAPEASSSSKTRTHQNVASEGEGDLLLSDSSDEDRNTESQKDYAKKFENYRNRFYKAYNLSKKLFDEEIKQRQTLKYYHRRNESILDLIYQIENGMGKKLPTSEEIMQEADVMRLKNIVEMNPRLEKILNPLTDSDNFDNAFTSSRKINMLIYETISDLINDDMEMLETNPQDIDPWIRKHKPHLVISKFKPMDVSGAKYEDADDVQAATKKRKLTKDTETDEEYKRLKK